MGLKAEVTALVITTVYVGLIAYATRLSIKNIEKYIEEED